MIILSEKWEERTSSLNRYEVRTQSGLVHDEVEDTVKMVGGRLQRFKETSTHFMSYLGPFLGVVYCICRIM